MSTRKLLLIASIILFLLGATGVPLLVNTVALGFACFAASHLYGS